MRRVPNRVFLMILAVGILVPAVDGAERVRIDVQVKADGPVFVGQRTEVNVKLFTATTFASQPAFEIPRLSGAILTTGDDRPTIGSEDVDGSTYVTQLYELSLYVLRPGKCDVPSFTVRFESAPEFGKPPVESRLTGKGFAVEAKMPPGAEGLPTILCSKNLTITETWNPKPGESARVGDSFTRVVTQVASDIPGMAMPPIPVANVEGLAAYPKSPIVEDHSERGDLTGKRVDTVVYVCEQAGTLEVPGLVIPWWNTESKELVQQSLPALTITVQAPPASAPSKPPGSAPSSWWLGSGAAWVIAAIALVGILGWSLRQKIAAVLQQYFVGDENNERKRFATLETACKQNDATQAYNALMRWLDRFERADAGAVATASDLLRDFHDPALEQRLQVLEDATLTKAHWDGRQLLSELQRIRSSNRKPTICETPALPNLNPSCRTPV